MLSDDRKPDIRREAVCCAVAASRPQAYSSKTNENSISAAIFILSQAASSLLLTAGPGFSAKAVHLGVVDKLAWQIFFLHYFRFAE
jgi:hypothetical protein